MISNPPYVPGATGAYAEVISGRVGPTRAWNAGDDGRLMLDPLCTAAPRLLIHGGTILIVQSEFSGVAQSLTSLRAAGMDTEIIASQWVRSDQVLSSRVGWLESTGLLPNGSREEQLVKIRADKP